MEDEPPRVRLWHRLAGRSSAPTTPSTAMLLAVFATAAVAQAGSYFSLGLAGAFDMSGLPREGIFATELVSFGLGLAVGSVASTLIGAPVTGCAAIVVLALDVPMHRVVAMFIGTWSIGSIHPSSGVTPVVQLVAGGASCGASWALVAVPWARRDPVPAWPWLIAAGVTLAVPVLRWAVPPVSAAITAYVPFLVVPVIAGLAGWLAWGWSAEDPAPPGPFEPRALAPAGLLFAGSAACWFGLWVWTQQFEDRQLIGGDVQEVRVLTAAACGVMWALGLAKRPRTSSLAWTGGGFLLIGGAVVVSMMPWWGSPWGRMAVTVLFDAGAVVVVAMVARMLVQHVPPGLLPLAIGAWVAIVAIHAVPPGRIFETLRDPRWDLQGPIAILCAVWGGLLLWAARVDERARADRIASPELPAEATER